MKHLVAELQRVVDLEAMLKQRDAEVSGLREALDEAKDDLDRDEEIFNDKMKQISALQCVLMDAVNGW